MTFQIVQKKIPLGRAPKFFVGLAIEPGGEGGDPIEWAAEVWERFEGFDLPDAALDLEEIDQFGVKREPIDIEAERPMTELSADIKKVTAAAAEIEDVERWFGAMQMQILGPFDVGFHPGRDPGVLGNLDGGVGVARFKFLDAFRIETVEQRRERNGMELPGEAASSPPVRFAAE